MGIFDGDDGERLKNFLLFKFYGTDKEFDELPLGGFLITVGILIGLFFLGIWIFG